MSKLVLEGNIYLRLFTRTYTVMQAGGGCADKPPANRNPYFWMCVQLWACTRKVWSFVARLHFATQIFLFMLLLLYLKFNIIMITLIIKFNSIRYVLTQQLSEQIMETVNQRIQKWREQYRGAGHALLHSRRWTNRSS